MNGWVVVVVGILIVFFTLSGVMGINDSIRENEAVLESSAVRPGIHACSIQRSTDAIIKLSKIMRMEFDEIRKRLDGMEKGESI